MPEPHPARRERLLAMATFGGIALATMWALDFLVTGGFDIAVRRSSSHYVDLIAPAPTSEQAPEGAANTEAAPLSSAPAAPAAAPLAGEHGDVARADVANYIGPSVDELYREIAALYAEQDATPSAGSGDDDTERDVLITDEAIAVNGAGQETESGPPDDAAEETSPGL
jgi:hypothetical protein